MGYEMIISNWVGEQLEADGLLTVCRGNLRSCALGLAQQDWQLQVGILQRCIILGEEVTVKTKAGHQQPVGQSADTCSARTARPPSLPPSGRRQP